MVSDSVWLDAGDLGQTYPRPNQDGAGALPKVFRVTHLTPPSPGLGSTVAGYVVPSDNSLPLGVPRCQGVDL